MSRVLGLFVLGWDLLSSHGYDACCAASGTVTRAEIEETYAISRRIEGEERSLDTALLVFTSTQQEVKDQWGLYDG